MFAQSGYMSPCYLADILDMKLCRRTYKSSPGCRRNKFCDKQYSPVLCLSERPSIDTNNASSPTRCFCFVIHNTLAGIIQQPHILLLQRNNTLYVRVASNKHHAWFDLLCNFSLQFRINCNPSNSSTVQWPQFQ